MDRPSGWTSQSRATQSVLVAELRANMVRAIGDFGSDKINGKILRAEEAKVHTMLVLGPRDLEAGNVSVRLHGKGNIGAKPKTALVARPIFPLRARREMNARWAGYPYPQSRRSWR